MDFFSDQAQKYGFDKEAYLDAVKRVPIWTQEQVNNYLFFIKGFVAVIAESGLKTLNELENRKQIDGKEKRHKSILETAIDGYWLVDTDGRLIEVNDSYCRMSGYSESELLSMSIADLDAIESAQDINARMQKTFEKGSARFETQHHNKDGTVFTVEISVQFRNEDGGQYVCFLRDITRQKLAEEALIKSEQKWRNILINTPQIGISLSQDAKITFANEHFQKLTGWSQDQIIGQNWFDMFIPHNIRQEVRKVFSTVMSQKTTSGFSTFDNEILHKNGSLINVSWSNVLTKDINGNIVDVTCLGVDQTERLQAEKALKESEAYMRSIFRAAPTGIGVVQDRVIRQVNDKFCDMLGYSSDELIGLHSKFVYPSDEEFEKVGKEKYEQIKIKGTGTVETVLKRKNGEHIDVLLSSTPININDLTAGVTFTALDITESKKAEKALYDSHKQFLTVLDSIDATIYVADIKSHEILFMNKYMIESFGQDMTGEACWKAFRKESGPCLNCNNDKLIDNNVPTGVIIWNDKNPRTGKWYINHDRAIKWTDGRLVRLQIATDVTDLLSMEKQLHQAQKMESVGRLAGGVAHDFNNMLGVILGHAELAMDDLDRDQPVFENLLQIEEAATRSVDITRQLLAFARKQIISPKVVDLNDTIAKMLKMLLRLIGEEIDLTWLPGNQLWPIKIDPSQIDQILANLCVNAKDAIMGIGNVTVETRNCNFDEEFCSTHEGFVPGQYVKIEVRDNGCGMDKETVSHMFEPFFTTKSVEKGTGLGLATVYGIVKQNNGFIKVFTELGQGTTFSTYLPRYMFTTDIKEIESSTESAKRGNETILLVEDEPAILQMTISMLQRLGYTILAAKTPNEAIRIASEHLEDIHLVLSDVVMPEMNGHVLVEKLMANRPTMKCLYMSGYTSDVISHHGVLEDDVHFIHKPFNKVKLAAKIRQALGDE